MVELVVVAIEVGPAPEPSPNVHEIVVPDGGALERVAVYDLPPPEHELDIDETL